MSARNTLDGSESPGKGPRLLTVRQAAAEMNICTRSVWRLLAEGVLDRVQFGRSVRIPMSSVNSLIDRGGAK